MFSLPSIAAHSGGSTTAGDGGHIVTCPGEKPVLLDYYEARILLGRDFDRQFDTGFSSQKLMARVEKLDGLDGRAFSETVAHVYTQIKPRRVSAELLPFSYSAKPFVKIPADCQVDSIAFRVRTPTPYFLVDREKWLLLDERQRELLRLHESLHDWFGGFGGSRAARQAVILILARDWCREVHRPDVDQLLENRFDLNWEWFD